MSIEKESKAAPIFWTILACVGEGIVFIFCLIGAIRISPLVLLVGLLPATVIGFMIYFLLQSLREIDQREAKREEWEKY